MTFGNLLKKTMIIFNLKDTNINIIPIKLISKLKISILPQEIEVIVKYKKITIPNTNKKYLVK
jgi:hypothetical protein